MRVKALQPGFFGGSLHQTNAEFDVPEGTKAHWFVPAEEFKAPAKAAKPKAAPQTLSELAKEPATDAASLA